MQIAFLLANWISFDNAVFCQIVVLFLLHFPRHLYPRRQLSSYGCQNNSVSWFPPNPGAHLCGTVQNPPRLCSHSLETCLSFSSQVYLGYPACSSFWSIFLHVWSLSSAKTWSSHSPSFLHPHLGPGYQYFPKLLSQFPISYSVSAPGTIRLSPGLPRPWERGQ